MPGRDALDMARERGLDLIEVAPTANPPVCRIMDYGKWKYEQAKREREAQKKQKMTEMKGIKMRPGTAEHDFQFKLKNVQKFLKEGDKVKMTVIFRSREITHPEFARTFSGQDGGGSGRDRAGREARLDGRPDDDYDFDSEVRASGYDNGVGMRKSADEAL